ncbi:unnamed protein product [Closterium sp. NIES-54]
MLALCREHRLEHRTKHIALRYFLARELQQCGQLRLAYVASEANTADIFTKALAPGFPTCTQHSVSSFFPVSSQICPFTLLLLSSLPTFPSHCHSLLRLSPLFLHSFPPPLFSPPSGAPADYSAVIPPPLIPPLNGSAADYLVPLPPPLITPINGSAADYLAPIPPPLIYPLNGSAADYLVPIPPPLITPLNRSATDYLAPIPPPLISPLNDSTADYFAPIPPLLSPHNCSIAIPYPRCGLFSLLPLFFCASALTLLPSLDNNILTPSSPCTSPTYRWTSPLLHPSAWIPLSHQRRRCYAVVTSGIGSLASVFSVTMPSQYNILGASPLMDPRFVVPFSPPLQSTASHSPSPTDAALSLAELGHSQPSVTLSSDSASMIQLTENHLPLAECTHFGQHWTAQALYDAVVSRYSSPATAALGRLLLPYLYPDLSSFATVEDLVSHLRASDARYCAAVPAEFLDKNHPPMFITLYFIVTRLPDSLRSVRDHFLSLDPTSLTVALLEQHLLAAETSAVAVGAARGTLRPPFFEGCSPSPLALSYASAAAAAAAAADVSVDEDVGAASASAKRRSGRGKGGKGGGGGSGGGGANSGSSGGGSSGGGGGVGTAGGSGGSGGGGGGSGRSGGSGGSGTGTQRGGSGGGQHLLKSRIAIFDLDFDAVLSAMYALSASAEGDCYQCEPPDPGIATADLGASESATLPGTTPTEALHTFTLDSGASRCFFRDSTTLTPLPAPVSVRQADPSGGPVVARSSTVLPCPAVPSGSLSCLHLPSFSTNLVSTATLQDTMVTTTTPGGQRVSICTCTRTGHHLATFTRQVAASCSCHLLSHQTLLWHHRLGHPSLPRLRGMHSRLLVSGLPRSLPPLPPSLAPPCLPCVEGRQHAAPHSFSFPPTTAPLQTLHMDVWGPARVSGQSRERYFLLVVDDYTRYTTVFPLRSKGQVVHVLIPWIHTVHLQLRERFDQDLPVLHLHSNRGGEFSSDLLQYFCHGEGILQSFTLPDSPQKNGIAERRIGLLMEVTSTSMIHAAAPHFLWPFVVRYAAHQLNLWPHVSLPETSPTLRWTGEVGDASVFRV